MTGTVLGVLLARTSPRARGLLVGQIVLAAAARSSLVATAVAVQGGRVTAVAALGLATLVVYALERAISSAVRSVVECDLYRVAARSLLEGDVLDARAVDRTRTVYDGINYGRSLLGTMFPSLVADGAIAVVVVPLLVVTLPQRVLALAIGALVVVAVGVFVVRRVTQRLEERSLEAYLLASDTLLFALEGRVEVVAHAGEEALEGELDRQLRRYEGLSVRAAWGTALLGRAPLAAATIAVGIVVSLDATSREALRATLGADGLLLAACMPPVMGAALAMHGAVRAVTFARPFVALLRAPARLDVGRRGGTPPVLPSTVRADAVTFAYAAGQPAVLDRATFAWAPGEPFVLQGPNGSGKSTLLRLLLGLRPPTSGVLRLGDTDLAKLDLRALRRRVAYLPQRPYLGAAHGSVRAALAFAREARPDAAMHAVLERVGLGKALAAHDADPLSVPIGELSAGQRQRLALARVLLHDADLVLLDEPDANLDQDGIELVASVARDLCARGKMVAIAAHSPGLVASSTSRLAFPTRPPEGGRNTV